MTGLSAGSTAMTLTSMLGFRVRGSRPIGLLGLQGNDLDVGVLALEELPHTRDSPAGPNARDKDVHLSR